MSVIMLAVMDKGSEILSHCLSQPKTTVAVGDRVSSNREGSSEAVSAGGA